MAVKYPRRKRTAIILLAVCLAAASGWAEKIPLRSGKTIDRDVLGQDSEGLLVAMPGGNMRIPWRHISASFKRHPEHVVEPRPEPVQREQPRREPGVEQGDERVLDPDAKDGFTFVLAALFVVFWLHVFSVWVVSRDQLLSGGTAQAWSLAALFLGIPVAALFQLRYKGLGGFFKGVGADGARPLKAGDVRLYTWDHKPLTTRGNRKLSSGLTMAEKTLARAVELGASDVHFDTVPEHVRLVFRVDGMLRDPEILETDVGRKTISAIKMAAGMDMARIHEAQDGACHLGVGEQMYDLRIARAYAVAGETLVIRLLKAGGLGSALTDFGMLSNMATMLGNLTKETAGIIIMAGPTGSGKTTTIYALLRQIDGTGRNILTIEDPVEYRLDNATQISLNAKAGSTFASALKASMRHDPDVILVGEIRDSETMDVAFQAALTGHLVFTTIHATSVLATYGRLQELGLSAYMINTGLKSIICQRLVRVLCPSCREPYIPELDELGFWGLTELESEGRCFYRSSGCSLCDDSGYRGRKGVYRVLAMNNDVRNMVRADVATGDLQQVVEENALGNIREYAREFLWEGVTAPDELRKTLDMFDFGKSLGASSQAGPGERGEASKGRPGVDVIPLKTGGVDEATDALPPQEGRQ
ncbi:MAG: type II/IV secretion system protein [Lentisphaerae bacterium]|nr:type II/IV secretion system protein [Lentisphaerota bacterium]MBT4822073.1 type II/IV secretion system protein [Lentisphaerota bacterium]MBT5610660.1 type II/IV secretion system protein [Lentisphaerota bacterium]MBT7059459.1 type II/IV secretion system protein [Lentisphaerota bacterium]MBT7847843.1 type II/IV secretion system protein [Lentisphaerota bacterium]